MNMLKRSKKLGWITVSISLVLIAFSAPQTYACTGRYVILAWNNLGMHCYNPSFRDIGVLPPYNVLWAQVIKVGDPPQFVTTGITIQYRFPGNTYSVGKTDFWSYAQQLFNLAAPLPPNTGLAGKGLSGVMDVVQDPVLGDHFEAVGIPLTEYYDWDKKLSNPNPFQLAEITVRDATTKKILAQTLSVAPVSSELSCITCHADTADATTRYPINPTGQVETNILALHDYLNSGKYPTPLMNSRPVLCASCHSSNALGAPGVAGISSLSFAMHNHHNEDLVMDIMPDTTAGCYNCHPGTKTRCLRDTMSQSFSLNCTTCHGNMADVASPVRNPWVTLPRCDNTSCHGNGYAMDQPLYRNSRGHGGVYCAGCHDSPHAITPSRQTADSLKFYALQGHAGSLKKCTVCHLTRPTASAFKHYWASPQ